MKNAGFLPSTKEVSAAVRSGARSLRGLLPGRHELTVCAESAPQAAQKTQRRGAFNDKAESGRTKAEIFPFSAFIFHHLYFGESFSAACYDL
jgi:hypothetical protein